MVGCRLIWPTEHTEGASPMNKREAVLSILDSTKPQNYIPAGFFLHFDPACHQSQAAVEKHLEFFRYTGMDFVKIQYERPFPRLSEIQRPEDWTKMQCYGKEFYQPQLEVVEGLVKAAKPEALVVVTLYSPFMCAGHTTSQQTVTAHLQENPSAVHKGMEIITDSLMIFVQECIRIGVDGFYHSTQGGESHRFPDKSLFRECIKPYDLMLMEEINRKCLFNILHVCDYNGSYSDLTPFLDYPGNVVNCNPHVGDRKLSGEELSRMFGRPFMGGLERLGILAKGTEEEVRQETHAVLREAPDRFLLAADCTVPSDTPWDNLKAAIEEAHRWTPTK